MILYLKKERVEVAAKTTQLYKDQADALKSVIDGLRSEVDSLRADGIKRERLHRDETRTLQDGQKVQEKRIWRVELEGERKNRMYLIARQEIEYFEDIIRIVMPLIASDGNHKEELKLIEVKLRELQDFRSKSMREQLEWEERREIVNLYMSPSREYTLVEDSHNRRAEDQV